MAGYQELREALAGIDDGFTPQAGWEVYQPKRDIGFYGVQATAEGHQFPHQLTYAHADFEGFGGGSSLNAAQYLSTVDPATVRQLLAERDQYLAALQAIDALDPEDFKDHEAHLPPAFQQPDITEAFRAVVKIVNGTLHNTDENGDPLPAEPHPEFGNCPRCGSGVLEDRDRIPDQSCLNGWHDQIPTEVTA